MVELINLDDMRESSIILQETIYVYMLARIDKILSSL